MRHSFASVRLSPARNRRKVSPPREEFSSLNPPLTAGEQLVFAFFDQHLPPDWEIYLQPHLNGLRPDFVLLNPAIGIAVFEVKDWNLDVRDYFIRDNELWAREGTEEVTVEMRNPVRQVEQYRDEIYNIYCPKLPARDEITIGVIFPFAAYERVDHLLRGFWKKSARAAIQDNYTITGREQLRAENINHIFPRYNKRSKFMTDSLARNLRGWLVEPDFSKMSRKPLMMDAKQKTYVTTRTRSGYRRIKGPAGSGKTVVLAARAARLAAERKTVLIASYNITLWPYIRSMVIRAGLELYQAGRTNREFLRQITFTHFHEWCKTTCEEFGWRRHYARLWKKGRSREDVLEEDMPALARLALEQDVGEPHRITRYDAILVDEGQDYCPSWWECLRGALKQGGEMILFADETQGLYKRHKPWTEDSMLGLGAGFSGDWAILDRSYRLAPDMADYLKKYIADFLPDKDVNVPEPASDQQEFPSDLRWSQCEPSGFVQTVCQEVELLLQRNELGQFSRSDICLLVETAETGREIEDALRARNIEVQGTFHEDGKENRRQKMAFRLGDARIRATTIHSFKGWEAHILVVCIREFYNPTLIYIALSRLKWEGGDGCLRVVCSIGALERFGKNFPDYIAIPA